MMEDIRIELADKSDPDTLRQIVEISKQWREQFIPESVTAIEKDYSNLPCLVLKKGDIVEAFLILVPVHLELEFLWAAGRRSSFRRAKYVRMLIERAEKDYFYNNPDCLICYAKTAAEDSQIQSDDKFDGAAAKGVRALLSKMGYASEYRLESYWQPDDHCLLAVKRKVK